MNIIERNFFRLLRSGAFGSEEQIEALSAWKWNRLFQLSEMHDVSPIIYKGIERCSDQFFVQVPEALKQQWSEATSHDTDEGNDLLMANHLTNPVLNHKLQDILDSEDSNTETRTALLHLSGIVRFIMNAGIPVKRVTEFGMFLRESSDRIDFITLGEWISKLKLEPMAQLTAVMLVKLMHFVPEELPFMKPITEEQMEQQLREMFQQKNSHAEEWYFSQGKNIFVHTSNSSAMLWHVRRSAKYFRYYPSETMTNFFTSFAHSLSHIEE
jgi:hypothetical protein